MVQSLPNLPLGVQFGSPLGHTGTHIRCDRVQARTHLALPKLTLEVPRRAQDSVVDILGTARAKTFLHTASRVQIWLHKQDRLVIKGREMGNSVRMREVPGTPV